MKKILVLLFAFAALNLNAIAMIGKPPVRMENVARTLMSLEKSSKPRISATTPIPQRNEPLQLAYTQSGKAAMWFLGGTFVVLAAVLISNILKVSK